MDKSKLKDWARRFSRRVILARRLLVPSVANVSVPSPPDFFHIDPISAVARTVADSNHCIHGLDAILQIGIH